MRRFQTYCLLVIVVAMSACSVIPNTKPEPIQVGASQSGLYLPLLKNKRVALVVNQTSRVNNMHLADFLLSKQINVVRIFAPEHGFRGDYDAGAHVSNDIDQKTGIAITSIYGKHKKPSKSMMNDIDIVIFDIQDVGVRFYTYISSMHYMMEAAAESSTQFMVFDRPNPNGRFTDGPILETAYKSFVGMHPIPILHGMTVAELALMIKGENWINQAHKLDLLTIANANYRRTMHYNLPIAPSPNLPNAQSVQLYPSLCFFEATPVSIGRGTDFPFQVIGHNSVALGEFSFTPESRQGAALNPKLQDQALLGTDLRLNALEGLDLQLFIKVYKQFSNTNINFFERANFMDKLAGTNQLRLAIEQGKTAQQIQQSWLPGINAFKEQRKPYLLYDE